MATWTKSLADEHTYLLSKSLSVNETYTLFVSGSHVDMKCEVYLGTDFFIGYLEGNKLTFTLEQANDATFLTFYILSSDAEIKTIKLETGGNPTNYKPATAELLLPLNRDSYMSPAMTYQMNGNILNFDGETVKRVTKDSNGNPIVVSSKGINLVRNGIVERIGKIEPNSAYSAIAYSAVLSTTDVIYVRGELSPNEDDAWKIYIRMQDGFSNMDLGQIYSPVKNQWHTLEDIITPRAESTSPYMTNVGLYLIYPTAELGQGKSFSTRNVFAINLTQAYGAGNEPTLEYIQAHPEEFACTPNPNDLIETVEIKNNLIGDLENPQGSRLLINSLKIYNRNLTDAEMIQNYKVEKERFGM